MGACATPKEPKIYGCIYEPCPPYNEQQPPFKVLILGSGSTGKSTVFKCIKHANAEWLDEADQLHEARCTIRESLAIAMFTLLRQSDIHTAINKASVTDEIQLVEKYASSRQHSPFHQVPPNPDHEELQKLGDAIYALWKLPGIQQTFPLTHKQKFAFPSNMDYFFEKARECFAESYVPTHEDCLKLRLRTAGVVWCNYRSEGDRFYVLDVGGERIERKKWIHCFGTVSGVLYVCALDQYCRCMVEDEQQLGLLENIQLFDELLNGFGRLFKGACFVLLLNKMDLFREALKVTPLTFCFGDEYQGRNYENVRLKAITPFVLRMSGEQMYHTIPADVTCLIGDYFGAEEYWLDLCVEDGVEFIAQKYLELNQEDHRRTIFVHRICSVDVDQVAKVMRDVQHAIVMNYRREILYTY